MASSPANFAVDKGLGSRRSSVMSDLPYIVSVHGALTDDGFWNIEARLVWPLGPPHLGSEALGRGLMALLQAIADEGERGHSLGATKIQVDLQGNVRYPNLVLGTETPQ